MNIVYLTNIPTPYKSQQINAWIETLSPLDDLKVWYLGVRKDLNLWEDAPINKDREVVFRSRTPIGRSIEFVSKWRAYRRGLVIIGGYYGMEYWAALVAGRLFGARIAVVYDGIAPKRFSTRKGWKNFLKTIFLGNIDAILGNGLVSRTYFSEIHGIPCLKLFNQALFCDPTQYGVSSPLLKNQISEKRLQLHASENAIIFGFCGRLIPRKRVQDVLEAVRRYSGVRDSILIVIGDGPERLSLEAHAKSISCPSKFVGGIGSRPELLELLGCVDVFLLPSEDEPWGMVVNEAVSMGCKVVSSDDCGVSLDLRENRAARVYPVGNIDMLLEAMSDIVDEDLSRDQIIQLGMSFNSGELCKLEFRRFLASRAVSRNFQKMGAIQARQL